jgi:hypothetical protein
VARETPTIFAMSVALMPFTRMLRALVAAAASTLRGVAFTSVGSSRGSSGTGAFDHGVPLKLREGGHHCPAQSLPNRIPDPPHFRVRHDTIDTGGTVTLRYNNRLTTSASAADWPAPPSPCSPTIRKLVLNPARDYQPRGVPCGRSPKNRQ